VVLLSAQLIGKAGGVNHGLLALVLRALGPLQDLVHLSVHGVDRSLDGALVAVGLGVDGGHLDDSGPRLSQLRPEV
jgi:hypothetical protein